MNKFDKKLKALAKKEVITIPENITSDIKNSLAKIKTLTTSRRKPIFAVLKLAFAAVVASFFILPNVNSNIAFAMQSIPVFGSFVKVITLRHYEFNDDYHSAKVNIPEIDGQANDSNTQSAINYINADIKQMTDAIIKQFDSDRKQIGKKGHTALNIDYDVMTNSETWFTLKLTIWQGAGSSNTTYKFYHIDKISGKIVKLSDLFKSSDYVSAISKNISSQMKQHMKKDENVIYWVGEEEELMPVFKKIKINQNFYFDKSGNMVIVFNKYDVAPGYMGCPEFTIPKNVYSSYLK